MNLGFLPYSLLNHQIQALEKFYKNNGRLYLLHETGTGKTFVYCAMVEFLKLFRPDLKTVIACPKTLIDGVFKPFFEKYGLEEIPCFSYEFIARNPQVLKGFDFLVCDEVHKVCNHSSKTAKIIKKQSKNIPFICVGTGTPMPREYTDYYIPYSLVSKTEECFTAWANHYGSYNIDLLKWFPTKTGIKEMIQDISSFIHVAKLKNIENNNMKEIKFQEIKVEISAEHKEYYDTFGGKSRQEILMMTGASGIMALRQICSDIYQGKSFFEKAEVLLNLLDSIEKPVIIWVTFRKEAEQIYTLLPDGKKALWIGGTEKNLDDWNSNKIDYLVANARSVGVGFNLQRCHNNIYHSLDWSLTDFQQSRARTYRLGQKEDCNNYYLCYGKTIEERIWKVIQRKECKEQDIKNLIENEMKGLVNGRF